MEDLIDTTNGSPNSTKNELYYQDGDIIETIWHPGFIFLAYFTSFVGAYSAIRLLEHGLWRSKREQENARLISKYPMFGTALVLGTCTIWSMHFIGMQAVSLEHVPMCYNVFPTLASLGLSVFGVWLGVVLASRDIFNGEDRVEKLKNLLKENPHVTSKMNRQRASLHIHMVALFTRLHWIAAGAVMAALGALSMHYVGMIAMTGPFRRQWSLSYLISSVILGVVVCFAGFWILFRPLHWKVEKNWYRYASAMVISLAVCCLHFLGMQSVTYIADSTQQQSHCVFRSGVMGWRMEKVMVLGAAMFVPFVAFVIEHSISNELRITYRQLLDIKLTRSEFLRTNQQGSFYHSTASSSLACNSVVQPRKRGSKVKISGLSSNDLQGKQEQVVPSKQRKWKAIFAATKRKEDDSCLEMSEVTQEDDLDLELGGRYPSQNMDNPLEQVDEVMDDSQLEESKQDMDFDAIDSSTPNHGFNNSIDNHKECSDDEDDSSSGSSNLQFSKVSALSLFHDDYTLGTEGNASASTGTFSVLRSAPAQRKSFLDDMIDHTGLSGVPPDAGLGSLAALTHQSRTDPKSHRKSNSAGFLDMEESDPKPAYRKSSSTGRLVDDSDLLDASSDDTSLQDFDNNAPTLAALCKSLTRSPKDELEQQCDGTTPRSRQQRQFQSSGGANKRRGSPSKTMELPKSHCSAGKNLREFTKNAPTLARLYDELVPMKDSSPHTTENSLHESDFSEENILSSPTPWS